MSASSTFVCNPLLRVYLSNAERFAKLYGDLQSIVPRGRADTPVRLQRTQKRSPAAGDAATLGDTLGAETDVLVVVDPGELPRTYATVDILAEKIGDARYRVVPGDGADETGAGSVETTGAGLLPPGWGEAMRQAAEGMAARVTLGDPHLDAKLFVYLLPHGTGS